MKLKKIEYFALRKLPVFSREFKKGDLSTGLDIDVGIDHMSFSREELLVGQKAEIIDGPILNNLKLL